MPDTVFSFLIESENIMEWLVVVLVLALWATIIVSSIVSLKDDKESRESKGFRAWDKE